MFNTIGINLWFVPQISEHCPKKIPGFSLNNVIVFKRPGVASALTPSLGIVQECSTSADETNS
jgi:hypothetical protein